MKLWKNLIGTVCFLHLFYYQNTECQKLNKNFSIFWTTPSFSCDQYGFDSNKFYQRIQKFVKNNSVVTFSNPELLRYLSPEKMDAISYVSLQITDIRQKVSQTFNGLGALNYIMWQPVFRQNIGPLEYFHYNSIKLERQLYPILNKTQNLELATLRFEFAASIVLNKTINTVKNIWPSATWGLFDYPKCNFLSGKQLPTECDPDIMEDNDKLSWLWELDIALFPLLSIPFNHNIIRKQKFIEARLREAKRISEKYKPPLKIFPYLILNYSDYDKLISKDVLIEILKTFVTVQTDGLIIWDKNYPHAFICYEYYQLFEHGIENVLYYFLKSMEMKYNINKKEKIDL